MAVLKYFNFQISSDQGNNIALKVKFCQYKLNMGGKPVFGEQINSHLTREGLYLAKDL